MDVLVLLNKGHTFKECANLLGVSESTIKTHATNVYEKLGVSNLQSALYEARVASLVY
jgi:DNA-binding NarL/FixJ family response regulator